MNPFLRYLADKNSAHRQTDRHTPMTTRPCGLRRAGNDAPNRVSKKILTIYPLMFRHGSGIERMGGQTEMP